MTGLTSISAQSLLKEYGENSLKPPRNFHFLTAFLSQFTGFLIILLLLSAVVSFAVGETIDAIFILLIVFLNAIFGFYQEFKSEQSLSALNRLTVTTTRVVRDGIEQEIDSRFLVPGDLIYLESGIKVPADAHIVESHHFQVNESALTGESLPVDKSAISSEHSQLFMGTLVTGGRGYATVSATGPATRFGQIAEDLRQIKRQKTPIQKKLDVFTKQIGLIGILAAVIVFGISFLQDKSPVASFIFAVSLAVAAVPEGLPAVMTITLAIGIEKMARKKAIVRKLNSIETLGSVTLLATDKTGTLTTNNMQVEHLWLSGQDYTQKSWPSLTDPEFSRLLDVAVVCSTAQMVYKENHGSFDILGDMTEGALYVLAHNLGLNPVSLKSRWQIQEEIPFSQSSKKMTMVVKNGDRTEVFTKGSPESILNSCTHLQKDGRVGPMSLAKLTNISKHYHDLAAKGYRVLAFSYKTDIKKPLDEDQIFLGFVGLADPLRPEAAAAVAKATSAGIRVVMITGDNPETARAIGLSCGIIKEGDDILTGSQLDAFSDAQILDVLPKVAIFARTTPQHKHRIVALFQKLGHVVAVTGDGVNDVLALKKADVGVAMGKSGSDVAKETADIVITDDNFATLVGAIEEGRNIYRRITSAIKLLLACNLGEVIYIILSLTFSLPSLNPLQILYVNLVTDGLPAISLAFSPGNRDIMRQPPQSEITILSRKDYGSLFFVGITTAVLSFVSIIPYLLSKNSLQATSVVFTTMIFVQHFVLLDSWLSHKSVFGRFHLLKNPVFLAAFFIPIFIHPFVLYSPHLSRILGTTSLPASSLVYSLATAACMFIILETRHFFHFRHSS